MAENTPLDYCLLCTSRRKRDSVVTLRAFYSFSIPLFISEFTCLAVDEITVGAEQPNSERRRPEFPMPAGDGRPGRETYDRYRG